MAKEKGITPDAPATEHPNKIGVREGIGYMLGDGGNLFLLTYVSSYLKVFYTDVLKIPTKSACGMLSTTLCGVQLLVKNDPTKTVNTVLILSGLQFPLHFHRFFAL